MEFDSSNSLLQHNFADQVDFTDANCVCIADEIAAVDDGLLRGHGTQVADDRLLATVCGTVDRVNKLVTVKPLHSRYVPQIGDVVVGRVVEVAGKRWKIDLESRHEAQLLLSAVNLPGNSQKRRTAEDELQMRSFLKEGDLISAEVQSLHADGTVMLHTRSQKYGKLKGGVVLIVPADLVKRQKRHFQHIERDDIDVIYGCNGVIWMAAGQTSAEAARKNHEKLSRLSQSLLALSKLNMMIYGESVHAALQLSLENSVSAHDITSPSFLGTIATAAASR